MIQLEAQTGTQNKGGEKECRTVGTQMLHSPIHPLIARASKYTPLSWDDVSEISGGGTKTPREHSAAGIHHERDCYHPTRVTGHGGGVGEGDPKRNFTDQRGQLDLDSHGGARTVLTDATGNSVPLKATSEGRYGGGGGGERSQV